MRLRKLIAPTLAPLALVVAACGSSGSAATSPGNSGTAGAGLSNVTLLLNWYPYGEHAPFYYGLKTGIFKKYGINLTIQPGTGSQSTVQAIGNGRAPFGWADTPSLLGGIDRGAPVESLGVYLQRTPAAVQFFCSHGITRPTQLKGLTIATTAGDALSRTFPLLMAHAGVAPSAVTLDNTSGSGKIAAVASGRVDALLGNENDQGPTIQQKTGKKMCNLPFADYAANYYSDGLIASTGVARSNPSLAKHMSEAVQASWKAALQHPAAAAAAMNGSSPELPPPNVVKQEFNITVGLLHTTATKNYPPGADTAADWQATISTLLTSGVIPKAPSPGTYWNASLAPKA